MATNKLFDVEFEIVKKSGGGQGAAYQYRRGTRKATIIAASMHPADILSVLTSDITGVQASETIEILSIRPGQVSGSEGGLVLS